MTNSDDDVLLVKKRITRNRNKHAKPIMPAAKNKPKREALLPRPPAKKPPPLTKLMTSTSMHSEDPCALSLARDLIDFNKQVVTPDILYLLDCVNTMVPPVCYPGDCDSSLYTNVYLRQTGIFPKCSSPSQPYGKFFASTQRRCPDPRNKAYQVHPAT